MDMKATASIPRTGATADERVARACRLIESAEAAPSQDALARALGCSPGYLHRCFKAVTGLTPKQYADAHRAGRVRGRLGEGGRVTDAIYAAGFGSSSRFYEQATRLLGMAPGHYRAGGRGERLLFAVAQTSLGALLVASSARGVVAITLGDDAAALVHDLQDRFPQAELVGGDAGYEALVARVVGFIEAPRLGLELPLDIRGTAFQQRVWQALRQVPAGVTVSYAELARRLGRPGASRAVAGACAANALAVAVPCHRVVRSDGALSGYAWGVERKRALLDRETASA